MTYTEVLIRENRRISIRVISENVSECRICILYYTPTELELNLFAMGSPSFVWGPKMLVNGLVSVTLNGNQTKWQCLSLVNNWKWCNLVSLFWTIQQIIINTMNTMETSTFTTTKDVLQERWCWHFSNHNGLLLTKYKIQWKSV